MSDTKFKVESLEVPSEIQGLPFDEIASKLTRNMVKDAKVLKTVEIMHDPKGDADIRELAKLMDAEKLTHLRISVFHADDEEDAEPCLQTTLFAGARMLSDGEKPEGINVPYELAKRILKVIVDEHNASSSVSLADLLVAEIAAELYADYMIDRLLGRRGRGSRFFDN